MRVTASIAATLLLVTGSYAEKEPEGAMCTNFDDCAKGLTCQWVFGTEATWCVGPYTAHCYSITTACPNGYHCDVNMSWLCLKD